MRTANRCVFLRHLAVWLGCMLLAFLLTYLAGGRGFFAFDQSIVFDGSYRVLTGQVPYRDFVMPFGPITFWLHSLFFHLLGVSFESYLIGSALVGLLATLAAMLLVRLILGSNLLAELVAGLLTAVWFYPPFGTPWVDQTAFLFALMALVAIAGSLVAQGRWLRPALIVASGVIWTCAFLSKQNVGAFVGPFFPIAIVLGWGGNRRTIKMLCLFAAGVVAGWCIFLLWLYLRSDPSVFVEYVFRLPSKLGTQRLRSLVRTGFGLLRPYFDGRGPWIVNVLMAASFTSGIVGLVRGTSKQTLRKANFRLGCLACIYLPVFQHIFINTTLNQAANGFAFAGVSFAVATGLVQGMARVRRVSLQGPGRTLRLLILIIVTAGVAMSGIKVAMRRSVHDIFSNPGFHSPIEIDVLRPLRWAEPTAMGDYEITEESIVKLYSYLKDCHCNFFIFPDFTIFYGLLGVPSPQPLLWFHRDVTYQRGANTWLDRRISEDLERKRVEVLVLEQVSWFNTGERLNDFPITKRYLMANFAMEGKIGTFRIYRRIAR